MLDKNIPITEQDKFRSDAYKLRARILRDGLDPQDLKHTIIRGSGYIGNQEYQNTRSFFENSI